MDHPTGHPNVIADHNGHDDSLLLVRDEYHIPSPDTMAQLTAMMQSSSPSSSPTTSSSPPPHVSNVVSRHQRILNNKGSSSNANTTTNNDNNNNSNKSNVNSSNIISSSPSSVTKENEHPNHSDNTTTTNSKQTKSIGINVRNTNARLHRHNRLLFMKQYKSQQKTKQTKQDQDQEQAIEMTTTPTKMDNQNDDSEYMIHFITPTKDNNDESTTIPSTQLFREWTEQDSTNFNNTIHTPTKENGNDNDTNDEENYDYHPKHPLLSPFSFMKKSTSSYKQLSSIQKWNLFFSILAWSFTISNLTLVIGTSNIIILAIGGNVHIASIPLGSFFLGSSFVNIYISDYLFTKYGPKTAFIISTVLFGIIGGTILSVISSIYQYPYLYMISTFFYGMSNGISFFLRFIVMELVPYQYRAKAITLTISGGVIAAFIGPETANAAKGILTNNPKLECLGVCFMTGIFYIAYIICIMLIQFPNNTNNHQEELYDPYNGYWHMIRSVTLHICETIYQRITAMIRLKSRTYVTSNNESNDIIVSSSNINNNSIISSPIRYRHHTIVDTNDIDEDTNDGIIIFHDNNNTDYDEDNNNGNNNTNNDTNHSWSQHNITNDSFNMIPNVNNNDPNCPNTKTTKDQSMIMMMVTPPRDLLSSDDDTKVVVTNNNPSTAVTNGIDTKTSMGVVDNINDENATQVVDSCHRHNSWLSFIHYHIKCKLMLWKSLLYRIDFIIPMILGTLSWTIMPLPMSVLRIAMYDLGYSNIQSIRVMEFHFVGMFGTGLITGTLIELYGPIAICCMGANISIIAVLINLLVESESSSNIKSPVSIWFLSMTLLGIGWNFSFNGATVWLTKLYTTTKTTKNDNNNETAVVLNDNNGVVVTPDDHDRLPSSVSLWKGSGTDTTTTTTSTNDNIISSTTSTTTEVQSFDKTQVQSTNDTFMFFISGGWIFSAGYIYKDTSPIIGWKRLNLVTMGIIFLYCIILGSFAINIIIRKRRYRIMLQLQQNQKQLNCHTNTSNSNYNEITITKMKNNNSSPKKYNLDYRRNEESNHLELKYNPHGQSC